MAWRLHGRDNAEVVLVAAAMAVMAQMAIPPAKAAKHRTLYVLEQTHCLT